MSTKAGNLLWNRMQINVVDGPDVDIDTGLRQTNLNFDANSVSEPPMGVTAAPPGPPDGASPASRIMVIPLPPLADWASVSHGEPYVDPTTGTVHVQFSSGLTTTLNVLFWDPHSLAGPGQADTYNAPIIL